MLQESISQFQTFHVISENDIIDLIQKDEMRNFWKKMSHFVFAFRQIEQLQIMWC